MTGKITPAILIRLLLPLLLFAVLILPYGWLNAEFLVDWLGCGCPRIDEQGNVVEDAFNANDATALFWFGMALCTTALGVRPAGRLPRRWMRAVYLAGLLALSLWIGHGLTQAMLWS